MIRKPVASRASVEDFYVDPTRTQQGGGGLGDACGPVHWRREWSDDDDAHGLAPGPRLLAGRVEIAAMTNESIASRLIDWRSDPRRTST